MFQGGWTEHSELSIQQIEAKRPEERTEEEREALLQADPANMREVAARKKARNNVAEHLRILAEGSAPASRESTPVVGEATQRRLRVEAALEADGLDSDDDMYEMSQQKSRREGVQADRQTGTSAELTNTYIPPPTPPTPTSGQPRRTSTNIADV